MNKCDRDCRLLKCALVEHRIYKYFKRREIKEKAPSKILTEILNSSPIKLKLSREQRKRFISLISRILEARKIIEKYRKIYAKRPRIFYKKVFGFEPRKNQKMKIIWNPNFIHFIFEKNDLIAFWRKVGWGPGSGAHYEVGDRDIKIKELRGLISFGRNEYSLETNDTILHESIHSFDNFVKGKKIPSSEKLRLYSMIKFELSACLHNFKDSESKERKKINEKCRKKLSLCVSDFVNEYLRLDATKENIQKVKRKIRKAKYKKEKKKLREKLEKLKKRLEMKKRKKKKIMKMYREIVKEVKKALKVMPIGVVRAIIFDVPFHRLSRKIPKLVRIYRGMERYC